MMNTITKHPHTSIGGSIFLIEKDVDYGCLVGNSIVGYEYFEGKTTRQLTDNDVMLLVPSTANNVRGRMLNYDDITDALRVRVGILFVNRTQVFLNNGNEAFYYVVFYGQDITRGI